MMFNYVFHISPEAAMNNNYLVKHIHANGGRHCVVKHLMVADTMQKYLSSNYK